MGLTEKIGNLSIMVSLIFVMVSLFWSQWGIDLSAHYFAARSCGSDQPDLIYLSLDGFFSGSASEAWRQMAVDLGHSGETALPYVYPPIWVVLFAPLAINSDPTSFFQAGLLVHIALYLASMVLAFRIVAPKKMTLGLWMTNGGG